jgi:uncharacterized protein
MGEQVTEDIRSRVWLDLDDLNTPYLIDLSVFHKLGSPDLCKPINRAGKTFYQRKELGEQV